MSLFARQFLTSDHLAISALEVRSLLGAIGDVTNRVEFIIV
jgi:hypothetical protein